MESLVRADTERRKLEAGLELFTITVTAEMARRLRFVAGEQGTTPEAFAADAAMAMVYAELNTADFTDEKSDQERARAAELSTVPA